MQIEEKKKILNFIYEKWNNQDGNDGIFDFFNKEFENIADEVFLDLTKNIKKNENFPYLIRIAGQSGSGKTTQLMPAIKTSLDKIQQNYILLAVRNFAKYHPNYNELLAKYGNGLIREKTNGFALTLLVKVLEKLIENKYNILFEVTLLEPIFEEYLIKILKKNNYIINFNILAVAIELSDKWINERQNKKGNEVNRIVFKSSSSYFYDVLPKALNILVNNEFFDKKDSIIIWNAFDEVPCLETNVFDNNILNIFEKYRKIRTIEINDEKQLLESKIAFYENFYKKTIFIDKI